MTLTKVHMSQKIADDRGFMKGEAAEVLEKLLDIPTLLDLAPHREVIPENESGLLSCSYFRVVE